MCVKTKIYNSKGGGECHVVPALIRGLYNRKTTNNTRKYYMHTGEKKKTRTQHFVVHPRACEESTRLLGFFSRKTIYDVRRRRQTDKQNMPILPESTTMIARNRSQYRDYMIVNITISTHHTILCGSRATRRNGPE